MSPNTAPTVLRVLLADDRPRTRRALRALLAAHPGFAVAGEAGDGEAAMAAVERDAPDVALLDLRMPRLDGLAATARIKARWPGVRVVVHSLALDGEAAALAAGADAFVSKGAAVADLLRALRPEREA